MSTGNPTWYKDSVIYQTHVRAFKDANDDGIGDFRGLTEKLSYIQDLGISVIWLLPFFPSPLKDDGYDISAYDDVNPIYGSLHDFRKFLKEAHHRDIRVIIELVVNHTSDQHPWFKRARKAPPGSPERNFYVWSDSPDKYRDTRIIFKDFERSNWSWDNEANAYYWHRFYHHQPDLNFDNPAVRKAIFRNMDFWLQVGVDGLRLDAIPYLFEREGTNCENLPETHEFLKKLRGHVDAKFRDRMLLAEANQWPEDAVAYFGTGDECHMSFHFPIMPRMFMAVRMEDRYPIIDILKQTPSIPEGCQWALFLRNHDELTLEMVTDEERDYMYRIYAHDHKARINLGIRRRLAPLLGNDRRLIELLNSLLFSLPGTPVIYYGDELGMGDNIYIGDRSGVRTPMQWSCDRNAGFSRANPQSLYLPVIIEPEYHYESINVESQQSNPNSLLWWMKRLIAIRRQYPVLSRGEIEFVEPENRKVLAFFRKVGKQQLLIVANLSKSAEYVELNLSQYRGLVPVEVFNRREFPPIGELPYFVTLAPYGSYWFSLEERRIGDFAIQKTEEVDYPTVNCSGAWSSVLVGKEKSRLESSLPPYLKRSRWYAGKSEKIRSLKVQDAYEISSAGSQTYLVLVRIEYENVDSQTYVLPMSAAFEKEAEKVLHNTPRAVIAKIGQSSSGAGVLFDALASPEFGKSLMDAFVKGRAFKGKSGQLVIHRTPQFKKILGKEDISDAPLPIQAEQSNSSLVFKNKFILKLYRKLEEGISPEVEMGQFLTVDRNFPNASPLAGHIELRQKKEGPTTIAVLHGFIPNQGDAWSYTLDNVKRFFERILATAPAETKGLADADNYLKVGAGLDITEEERQLIGPYLVSVEVLAKRTAEFHKTMAAGRESSEFAPESFSDLYRRSLYQSMRNGTAMVMDSARQAIKRGTHPESERLSQLLGWEKKIYERFGRLLKMKIKGLRVRTHGDYHLGQVLYTGKDFILIDFEGEPIYSIGARKIKRMPLRDVGGMLRSFHYAACYYLMGDDFRSADMAQLEKWAAFWYRCVATVFLNTYLSAVAKEEFLPKTELELQTLMDVYVLDKALYEVRYELSHRPNWVRIPIHGIAQLMKGPALEKEAVNKSPEKS